MDSHTYEKEETKKSGEEKAKKDNATTAERRKFIASFTIVTFYMFFSLSVFLSVSDGVQHAEITCTHLAKDKNL